MWIGEVLFLLLCEAIGVLLVQDKIGYTVGLVLGVILAMVSTYHIWYVLDQALDYDEKTAEKMIGTKYLIRYLAIIILILLLYFTGIGSPFAAFLGYMSLKAGAYIQPLIDKVNKKEK
ncbi:MAG: ATP synthase subunit I [Lachnospiraceae bacterium]|nr:ATP synthase subunit I [Lachnospiraceae bacterium]